MENEYDDVVWAGDINAEFSRNTHYTNVIQSFVEEKSLLKWWDKWPIDFSHHGELSGHSYTSILDNFFLSENISKYIKDAECTAFAKQHIRSLPDILFYKY